MTHHSTLPKARGGLDEVPYELSRLERLQSQLDAANMLIALKDLPTIIQRGRELRAQVEAEVWKIIAESANCGMDDLPVGEQTDAAYGQYNLDGSDNTVAGEMKAPGFDGGML